MSGLSLRSLLVPLVMLSVAFAGCVEDEKDPVGDKKDQIPSLPGWVVPDLPAIDAAMMLENHAKFVTDFPHRAENSDTHQAAREALAKELKATGLEVWRQTFSNDIAQENICAVKLGEVEPMTWIVVGGHYDTTTWDAAVFGGDAPGALVSQGAYDDGSGTRITVELAKAFATVPTYYSVLFCAFDGEERGLQGSREVFNAMKESDAFPHEVDYTRAMLDLDMFGINWPVRTPIYYDFYDDTLLGEVDKVRKALGVPDDMWKQWGEDGYLPPLGTSDYGHWSGAKIPTIFFISDFGELAVPTPVPNPLPVPAAPGTYPWWHWVDTVETMLLMAGGPDMLEAGFQTALDLSAATLGIMALHPEVSLTIADAGDES